MISTVKRLSLPRYLQSLNTPIEEDGFFLRVIQGYPGVRIYFDSIPERWPGEHSIAARAGNSYPTEFTKFYIDTIGVPGAPDIIVEIAQSLPHGLSRTEEAILTPNDYNIVTVPLDVLHALLPLGYAGLGFTVLYIDGNLTVRLNTTTHDALNLVAGDELVWPIQFTDMFFSNAAQAAGLTAVLQVDKREI